MGSIKPPDIMLAFVQLFSAVLASIYIVGAQAQAQVQMEAQVLPKCTKEYTVKPGDTCDGISAAQRVSTWQLAQANPQINKGCTNLFVGQKLCLVRNGENCQPTYVVNAGDTCSSIAKKVGTTFDALRANNPNIDAKCSNIYPKEVLCVAKGGKKAQDQMEAQVLPECTKGYTVKSGDFCDGISATQGVSTYQLAHANPQINKGCTNLFVGEKLCLARKGEDCQPTHIVQVGDTCASIARAAGTSFDTLRANNPNIDAKCSNIYPGEVLCVAKKKGLMYCQEEDM
ncbi:hypothetical protein BD779DRAFT_1650928 [Infundibulicybe gibba]|nr:hypothetical protein BD779DRAFT_1650928 [Infundibulicybe gibba]